MATGIRPDPVTEPAALRQTPWILRALLLTSKERIGKRREGNKEEGRAGGNGREGRGRREEREWGIGPSRYVNGTTGKSR